MGFTYAWYHHPELAMEIGSGIFTPGPKSKKWSTTKTTEWATMAGIPAPPSTTQESWESGIMGMVN
jgi:hypothetical protein